MVTNVSIAKRKKLDDVFELENLSDEDEVWDLVGHYLSVFCANIAYICSPEVIILGGILFFIKFNFLIIIILYRRYNE